MTSTYSMRLSASEALARRIAERLHEQLDPDDSSVTAFEEKGNWVVEVLFMHAPDENFLRELVRLAAGKEVLETSFGRVARKDWLAASLEGLKPVQAGRFIVHGSHDRAKVLANQIGIEIEAALAFGTGHHGTTLGCLRAIDRLARRGRVPARILDVGTGTGVLAIAAARAFRRPVIAGEIDRVGVVTARNNAVTNRAANFVEVIHANGLNHPAVRAHAPYDLIVANILLDPLKRLSLSIAAAAACGGTVVLSGLLREHAASARASYADQGLVLKRREVIEGWVTLTFARP
jgi:ribosomal protein L11 methyltransferase